MKFIQAGLIALPLILSACSGGGGGGSSRDTGGDGSLSLAITDAPVDGALNVLVEFTGVELKPVDGPWQYYNLSGESQRCVDWPATSEAEATIRCIDLLVLNGGASELILDGVTVPAGDYNAIRLSVNAERGVMDSIFVASDGGAHSLYIPSGSQSGLKLNSAFTIGASVRSDFVIDFDLRKSVNNPQGFDDYRLKPSLKLIENSRSGAIFGTVNQELIFDESCGNGDNFDMGNSVYIFSGDVIPVDISGADTDPYTTAMVTLDAEGDYSYRAAFLPEGTYTVAFTCQGLADDPAQVDVIVFNPEPPATEVVEVTPGSEHEISFPPLPTLNKLI